ncbi:hypothetical protein C1O66_01685 [Paucibacter aquatile]|uniref:Uncharacterized protein n=1 Tax=Kinneretia aquatilis TaxID=2070761 RepID=A0A2N8L345_9BURK|nr:hypothetical protein C1O66_01685 [Paucibacter aquatile]
MTACSGMPLRVGSSDRLGRNLKLPLLRAGSTTPNDDPCTFAKRVLTKDGRYFTRDGFCIGAVQEDRDLAGANLIAIDGAKVSKFERSLQLLFKRQQVAFGVDLIRQTLCIQVDKNGLLRHLLRGGTTNQF